MNALMAIDSLEHSLSLLVQLPSIVVKCRGQALHLNPHVYVFGMHVYREHQFIQLRHFIYLGLSWQFVYQCESRPFQQL